MRRLILCAMIAATLTGCDDYATAAPLDEISSNTLPPLGDAQ